MGKIWAGWRILHGAFCALLVLSSAAAGDFFAGALAAAFWYLLFVGTPWLFLKSKGYAFLWETPKRSAAGTASAVRTTSFSEVRPSGSPAMEVSVVAAIARPELPLAPPESNTSKAVLATEMTPMGLGQVIAKARPSVVCVRAGDSQGTGFYVARGWVATNAHVVARETLATVEHDAGPSVQGVIRWRDPDADLALIYTSLDGPEPLPMSDSSELTEGDDVIALGHPLGLGVTVTKGIVSARLREWKGKTFVQTDAAISPGNSGGPLIDAAGRVVGINTFLLTGGNALNFAIPIERAMQAFGATIRSEPALGSIACPGCQREVSVDELYCPNCGRKTRGPATMPGASVSSSSGLKVANPSQTRVRCPSCGRDAGSATQYCDNCGARLVKR